MLVYDGNTLKYYYSCTVMQKLREVTNNVGLSWTKVPLLTTIRYMYLKPNNMSMVHTVHV